MYFILIILISEFQIDMLILNKFGISGVWMILSNVVYGHAYISGTREDLLVFILRNIRTFEGSRVSARLDSISIAISEQFNTKDMRIKGLDMVFVCFDDHDVGLVETDNPQIYTIYCDFERDWCVKAKTISEICRRSNVSIEINVEDPMRYFLQHILVGNTGRILADEVIDYDPYNSIVYQEEIIQYKYSSWFLMYKHSPRVNVFSIENIGINFSYSLSQTELDLYHEQMVQNEETEPCEMCGKSVSYGYSLCYSCSETVDYMDDDGIYILKNGKMVNTLRDVKGVDY